MVGADHLQVVVRQALPEGLLVVPWPERRRAHELGALEAVAQVVERQEEVLRAGLGDDPGAALAAAHDLLEGVARAEVDDVDGHLRRLGEADDTADALGLQAGVARDAVVPGVRATGLGIGVGDDVDGHAVLGVHEDEPAVLCRPQHGPQDGAVVGELDARVGREELEGR